MLQWWEKEATNKKHIKSNIVQMKTFLKLYFWKQLTNGGYYGAVINKTKQNKNILKKTFFILKHIFMY